MRRITCVLYDVDILTEAMKINIGDMSFQEAYNRTRRILNITVSSATQYEMPKLLNYLTAPNVVAPPHALSQASSHHHRCTPRIRTGRWCRGIRQRPPYEQAFRTVQRQPLYCLPRCRSFHKFLMTRSEHNLNLVFLIYFILNPHVIPFLQKSLTPSRLTELGGLALFLARSEIQHRCSQSSLHPSFNFPRSQKWPRLLQVTELGIFPSFFYRVQAIMSQRYYGDITIVPDIGYADFLKILSNPTPKMVVEATIRGEHATWPKVSIIKNHLQIELTIDEILYRLRLRRLTENLQQVEQNKQTVFPEQANGDLLVGGSGTLKHRRQRSVGIAVGTIASPLETANPAPPGFLMRGSRSTPNVLSVEEKELSTKRVERKKDGRRGKEKPKRKKEIERVSLRRGLLMTTMESSETETKEDEWDEVVFGMGEGSGSGKSEEEMTVESGSDGSGNGSGSEGEESGSGSGSDGSGIEVSDYDDVEGEGETEDGNFTIESIDIDVIEN
ncbi:hypothetical protein BC937DRAFT_89121 [Endogone sp. FLAS-F59071]|nr:hypothetical protein BC937DRAFT_89121 [Endogone sp. FLAS-F59071]|eukprot:RUS22447.1 hypothetical protein BC937DRAFT_89121 [Endogone sp. FLAS-F59071]